MGAHSGLPSQKKGLEYPLSTSMPLSPLQGEGPIWARVRGCRHAPRPGYPLRSLQERRRSRNMRSRQPKCAQDSPHVPGGNTAVSQSVARCAPPPDRFAKSRTIPAGIEAAATQHPACPKGWAQIPVCRPQKTGWNTHSPIPRLCHRAPGPASSFQRGDSRLSTRSPGFRTM